MKTLIIMAIVGLLGSISLGSVGGSEGTGGENSVAGHPLEFWKKNIATLPEFQQQVQPALNQLAKKLPGLARDLRSYITNKNWYFVPVDLNTLPSSLVGVAFSTSQDALQTSGAVWVSSSKYNEPGRSAKDKAIDLMHELVMGQMIEMLAINVHGGTVDYDEVRALTTRILSLDSSDQAADLQTFVQNEEFGFYPVALPKTFTGTLNVREFISYWQGQLQLGAIPMNHIGFDDTKCASQLKPAADNNSFTFIVNSQTIGSGPTFQGSGYVNQISRPIFHATYVEYDLSDSETGGSNQTRDQIKIFVGSNMKIIGVELDQKSYVFDISTDGYKWSSARIGSCGTQSEDADGPYYATPYIQ